MTMSIETAMVARAQPQMMAKAIKVLTAPEATKGCSPELAGVPVCLEPPYTPLAWLASGRAPAQAAAYVPDSDPGGFGRLRVWIAPEQKPDWNHAELFLKQLYGLGNRVGFEIVGNSDEIGTYIVCQPGDIPVVATAFEAQFVHCELTPGGISPVQEALRADNLYLRFRDFYPPPPYSHLLTNLGELKTTPFASLLVALGRIAPPGVGFYQCLFDPVAPEHDWHRNVQILLDLEFLAKQSSGANLIRNYLQQAPSGTLHTMSQDVETKAHSDKPFFACAVRVGVLGEQDAASLVHLAAASTCLSLFQHGGKQIAALGDESYHAGIEGAAIRRMFSDALAYRPGFLLNSRELTGLVHLFPIDAVEPRELQLKPLDRLARPQPRLQEGTYVGDAEYAGIVHRVCIPEDIRSRGTHIVASTGMGKTSLMIHTVLEDIRSGKGVALIDPHGDMTRDLLALIPREYSERCIFWDPSDPNWVPLWNPLYVRPGGDRYRLADDLISAFKHVCRDWGDRLEHVIRNGLLGLSYTDSPTLYDLYMLTRRDSEESKQLREQILATARDSTVRLFWELDFKKEYRASELQSPKHKISKLVSSGAASLMLSQPDSSIDLRKIMDNGMILLVSLSGIGAELRNTLGGLLLNCFLNATVSRSEISPASRRPFSLFVDEASMFVGSKAIEEMVTQARKFGVSICFAHQYLRQFPGPGIDALSTVGSTIIGHVDTHDARFFVKDLQEKASVTDLMALDRREMVARIGTDVVRMRTPDVPSNRSEEQRRQIIETSRRLYCRQADDVKAALQSRAPGAIQCPGHVPAPPAPAWHFTEAELAYDEF